MNSTKMKKQHRLTRIISNNDGLEEVKLWNRGKFVGITYDDPDYARRIESIMSGEGIKTDLGETVLWQHNITKNTFFSKEVLQTWIISNFRVIQIDEKTHKATQLPLKYIEALIINQRQVSESQGNMVGAGVVSDMASGMAFSQRHGTSMTIGDLVFMFNGQVLIVFDGISDPEGVRKLVYMIKKQIYNQGNDQV